MAQILSTRYYVLEFYLSSEVFKKLDNNTMVLLTFYEFIFPKKLVLFNNKYAELSNLYPNSLILFSVHYGLIILSLILSAFAENYEETIDESVRILPIFNVLFILYYRNRLLISACYFHACTSLVYGVYV